MRVLLERLELKEKMMTLGGGKEYFLPEEHFITMTVPKGRLYDLDDSFEWRDFHAKTGQIAKKMGGVFVSDLDKRGAMELTWSIVSKKEGQEKDFYKKFVQQVKKLKEYKMLEQFKPKFSFL